MKLDPAIRARLVKAWHVATIIASSSVGLLALELPQYRADLGVYGAFILVGVKVVDLWLNHLPKLLPKDDAP